MPPATPPPRSATDLRLVRTDRSPARGSGWNSCLSRHAEWPCGPKSLRLNLPACYPAVRNPCCNWLPSDAYKMVTTLFLVLLRLTGYHSVSKLLPMLRSKENPHESH